MRGKGGAKGQSLPGKGANVARWYREYHLRLLAFLRANLQETDAQDVSQEVYLRLLRIPEERVVEHPRAYLLRVAAHVIADWRAGQKTYETRPPEELDIAVHADDAAECYDRARRRERVERALAGLPAHYRSAVVLKTRHGLSYGEIAGHLGVSERMVKRYIVKAYARLRDRLSAS